MPSSKYLTPEDLMGQDHTLKIASVSLSNLENEDGDAESRLTLGFEGAKKQWVLTAKTQLNTIAKVLGTVKANEWVGKFITIYPTTCSAFGDSNTPCIRVRPKTATPTQAKPPAHMATTRLGQSAWFCEVAASLRIRR
jgi:hypothetical protein